MGESAVPVGSGGVRFLINRARLSGTTGSLSWSSDFSTDNGQNWTSMGGGTISFSASVPRDVNDPLTGLPQSGTQRGLLVVRNTITGSRRWWVFDIRQDEVAEAGFDPSNQLRRVRVNFTNDVTVNIDGDLYWAT